MSGRAWPAVRLGDYCSKIGSGSTPRGGESVYQESGVSFIRSQNVYNGQFAMDGLAHLDEEHADHLKGVTVESGDVLLNITGDSVARSCRVPEEVLPARVNQHVAIIRPRPEDFDSRFVGYFFISPFMQETMLSLAGSGGTRKALTKEMIERFEVPRPPRPLQERIADILSAYDELVENNRRRMTLLEEAARQLYREWFVRLRFPGHEHTRLTNGVPEGWERMSLGAVADNLDRLRVPLSVFEREARPGSYPYHGAAGVLDHIDGYIFDGRYLLVGEDGTVRTQAGTPMLQLVEGKFWVSNHAHVLSGNIVSTEFLYCLLSFYPISGHVTGVAQPKLTQANLNRIPVLVPAHLLRDQFQDVVAAIFSQHFVLQAQNHRLRAARDLLLPRLMRGEFAV
ncbi:MAG: restriction endonuclease subunit S [Planctomycetota bacterium]